MALSEYRRKRSAEKTPEPSGKSTTKLPKRKASLIFVVQKHAASHLHYDFRLEVNGALKSWAVPKGPSLNPADKRLAMMVEDHPYDYKDFEGTIPKGNYGAGTVMVWDEGVYYPLDKDYQIGTEKNITEGLKQGKISFALLGEKLVGVFSLVKLKNSTKGNEWLLIKTNDRFISKSNVLNKDRSVKSGRTMGQIAKNAPEIKKKALKQVKVSAKDSAKHAKMPRHIKPMLSFLADKPFDDPNWLFEPKWDGYRAIAEVENQKVSLYSRNFLSFNQKFAPVVKALQNLHTEVVFDGEIVIFNKKGERDFQALQNYQSTGKGDLRYVIFDLLYAHGQDLRDLPLLQRKQKLKELLLKPKKGILRVSEYVIGKGKKEFALAKKKRTEGLMAKEINSPYISARSRSWLKIKTHARQEALICGFTAPRGGRHKFGALILGVYKRGVLCYVGHVGGGFDEKSLTDVLARMRPLISSTCPFKNRPAVNAPVTWVKPKLVCEVSFAEWTSDNRMRQPIFMGLREDKEPKEVKNEQEESSMSIKQAKSSVKKKPILTNLDKVYWPKEKYTKGDLLEYYHKIAPYILPYLKDRPQTLLRYPNGIGKKGFYQKNADPSFPDWVPRFLVKHKTEETNYILIPDEKTLLFTINLGCIDLHPFSSRIQSLDYPDYLILDLDPEKISFDAVIETAQAIHELLSKKKIPCYCKTSGATGLHIYIPLGAQYTYDQTRQFAELLALKVHEQLPRLTSVERSPSKRQKKVYVDYLQNNFGQTLAAPYCVRPRLGAPVSTPLEWSEVKPGLDPAAFNMKTIFVRLKKKGDIFAPILRKGIDMAACLKKLQS